MRQQFIVLEQKETQSIEIQGYLEDFLLENLKFSSSEEDYVVFVDSQQNLYSIRPEGSHDSEAGFYAAADMDAQKFTPGRFSSPDIVTCRTQESN